MANGDGVTYTVKELIGMLEKTLTDQMGTIVKRLDGIDQKLDDKASNDRVRVLEDRVSLTEGRLGKLELETAGSQAVTKFQRWVLAAVAIPCFGAIATLVWLASGGH